MRPVLALLCLVAFLANALDTTFAQDKTELPKFVSGSSIVLVPVVVTDKQGNHITGLTRDDFELRQDGKDQKIASFEEITSESTPVDFGKIPPQGFTNEAVSQHPKKLQIVVLDLLNTSVLNQSQARKGLIEFLRSSASEDALVAFVVLQANGIHLVHNFTSDRSILISALDKVQAGISVRDTETLTANDDISIEALQLQAVLSGGQIPSGGSPTAIVAQAKANMSAAQAQLDLSRESQAGLTTLECFQHLAQYFATVPGRKSLIWASTAFLFRSGSMTGELTRGATPEDWQRTVRMLQDANIAVYPVDVGGLVATVLPNFAAMPTATGSIVGRSAALEAVSAGVGHDPIQSKHDTMKAVAEETGGHEYYNNNNIGELFRRAAADSGQYYLLTYYASTSAKTGWHKIDVKVRKEGVQARSRDGFFLTKDMQNPELTRQQDEYMAVTSDLNFATLPLSGMWQKIEPAGNKRRVYFALYIPPGAAAIDTEHENHINLDFMAIARDGKGKEVAKFSQNMDHKMPAASLAQIQSNGITYVNTFTVPPGTYLVNVAVRDNLTGKLGSIVTPLKVD